MTIRFRGAGAALCAQVEACRARGAMALPANDNGAGAGSDALLHAALRHFAEHGLAAAHHARQQAETAYLSGDGERYQWWLEICRALDRAMARELDTRALG
jgi:hypothetical protein